MTAERMFNMILRRGMGMLMRRMAAGQPKTPDAAKNAKAMRNVVRMTRRMGRWK